MQLQMQERPILQKDTDTRRGKRGGEWSERKSQPEEEERKKRRNENEISDEFNNFPILAIRFYLQPTLDKLFPRQNEHHACKLQHAPVVFIKFLSVELIRTGRCPLAMVTMAHTRRKQRGRTCKRVRYSKPFNVKCDTSVVVVQRGPGFVETAF